MTAWQIGWHLGPDAMSPLLMGGGEWCWRLGVIPIAQLHGPRCGAFLRMHHPECPAQVPRLCQPKHPCQVPRLLPQPERTRCPGPQSAWALVRSAGARWERPLPCLRAAPGAPLQGGSGAHLPAHVNPGVVVGDQGEEEEQRGVSAEGGGSPTPQRSPQRFRPPGGSGRSASGCGGRAQPPGTYPLARVLPDREVGLSRPLQKLLPSLPKRRLTHQIPLRLPSLRPPSPPRPQIPELPKEKRRSGGPFRPGVAQMKRRMGRVTHPVNSPRRFRLLSG